MAYPYDLPALPGGTEQDLFTQELYDSIMRRREQQAAMQRVGADSNDNPLGQLALALTSGISGGLRGGSGTEIAKGVMDDRLKRLAALAKVDSTNSDLMRIAQLRQSGMNAAMTGGFRAEQLRQNAADAAARLGLGTDTLAQRTAQDKAQLDLRERELNAQIQGNKLKALEHRNERAENLRLKEEAKLNTQVGKLEDKIQGASNAAQQVNVIEDEIGKMLKVPNFTLEKYDAKKHDLPGVSVPALGRVSMYSSDARVLDDMISKVFNIELKDRSGNAVTNNELERVKSEFASGKFNTEEEKIGALKRYKIALNQVMKNVEAGYGGTDMGAKALYESRGGKTSSSLRFPAPGKEMTPREKLLLYRSQQGR